MEIVANNFFELEAFDVENNLRSLSEFSGKVVLVVNTASRCGFTKQYAALEQLYRRFGHAGFTVLAFPSNDYANQEPISDQDIKNFCQINYDVTFPIFSKNHVSGPDKQAVFKFLTEHGPARFRGDPGWNFVKFLISRSGTVVGRYAALSNPLGGRIVRAIERELAAQASPQI
ncbi:MAG: glutathione peroxidase [Bdellovibrionales bacterium]|nr:glutathione peroxidase [Bdellovibrionales bacterium]